MQPISRRRLAALHSVFLFLITLSAVCLRGPIWVLAALAYCCVYHRSLTGQRLLPPFLWRAVRCALITSIVCCLAANLTTRWLPSEARVHRLVWNDFYPLWALLGVQKWDTEDAVGTIALPTVAAIVLLVYLIFLERNVEGRALSRAYSFGRAHERFHSQHSLPRWAAAAPRVFRVLAVPLLAVLSWVAAWIAQPSWVGFIMEIITFVYVAASLLAEHTARRSHQFSGHEVRRGTCNRATQALGCVVGILLLITSAAQNGLVALVVGTDGDGGRQAGITRAMLNSLAGLGYTVHMLCMAGVLLGASLVAEELVLSRESLIPQDSGDNGHTNESSSNETQHLLVELTQQQAALPSQTEPRPDISPRYTRSEACSRRLVGQALATLCITALLAYAVCYPSLVSFAVWLLHMFCCVCRFVQRPWSLTPLLRRGMTGVFTLLSVTILLQYVMLVLARNPSTFPWSRWAPAKLTYPDSLQAVITQVAAEHLIVLLGALYVCYARDSASLNNLRRTMMQASVAPHESDIEVDLPQSSESADTPHGLWVREQVEHAGDDRERQRQVFSIAVGRSPRPLELDVLNFTARRRVDSGSPVPSRSGFTLGEVIQYVISCPLYTYGIVVSLFLLGASGPTRDTWHVMCIFLSLVVSVLGSHAALYRCLRLAPPICVAAMVGVVLGYRVFCRKPKLQPMSMTSSSSSSPQQEGESLVPYLYAQLVLLWCSRYEPTWVMDWGQVTQYLVFRCRWQRVIWAVHHTTELVALGWIVWLLPRSACVTVLLLLLFLLALMRHLRWDRAAYVWQRFLVVGYCGMVLLAMLIAELAPMQPYLRHLWRAVGCPPGAEGRCALDVGLTGDAGTLFTTLSTPLWLFLALVTAGGRFHSVPKSLLSASATGGDADTAATPAGPRWKFRVWLPIVFSQLLTVLLQGGMIYTAVRRPSLLTALYLVAPLVGVYPGWTLCVGAVHIVLQCTYQLWFSPMWLDTQMILGMPVARLLGLWRVTLQSPASPGIMAVVPLVTSAPTAALPPCTLAVATAPLLLGAAQVLQQRAAIIACRRVKRVAAEDVEWLTKWCTMRHSIATHLYIICLLTLLKVSQFIALGWTVGLLLALVWCVADVRCDGVLLHRRWPYLGCRGFTAVIALYAYVLHWMHVVFPSWELFSSHPWWLGGDGGENPRSIAVADLTISCWLTAVACVLLRVSSGHFLKEAEGEAAVRQQRPSASFVDWLRRRCCDATEGFDTCSVPLAAWTDNEIARLLRDAAEEFGHGGDTVLEYVDVATVPIASTHTSTGYTVVQVACLMPLTACCIVLVGSATMSPPCVVGVVQLVVGAYLAMHHASMQWNFHEWWRLLVMFLMFLPFVALLIASPLGQDAVAQLPAWWGLLIGFFPGTKRVGATSLLLSRRHVLLLFSLWMHSCLYNCPEWGVSLLRHLLNERQLLRVRHTALQQRLFMCSKAAVEKARRMEVETRTYLAALREGDVQLVTDLTSQPRRSSAILTEGNGDWQEDVETAVPTTLISSPPSATVEEAADDGRSEAHGSLGPASPTSATAMPSESTTSGSATGLANSQNISRCTPLSTQRSAYCALLLRRLSRSLAKHTYHPLLSPLSASAASEEFSSSLWVLGCHTLYMAGQVMVRYLLIVILACVVLHAVVTGCLWELFELCYVSQVALAYHPFPPGAVFIALARYLLLGVVLKALVAMWCYYAADTRSLLVAALSGVLLPHSKGTGYILDTGLVADSAHVQISKGTLCYRTLWIDVGTIGFVLLHMCCCSRIYGVYGEEKVGRAEHINVSEEVGVAASQGQGQAEAATPPIVPCSTTNAAATLPALSTSSSALLPRRSFELMGYCYGLRKALLHYARNLISVPGLGEDWYLSYTITDFVALLVAALFYSRMAGNGMSLQDNVLNNLLPSSMALLLCLSVLQLVADRVWYVTRSMRLKAFCNLLCTVSYSLVYWRWRNSVNVTAHGVGDVYFIIKIIALIFSVMQVCRGFPLHRRRDAFTTRPGSLLSYCCFTVHRALPFLWEVRTLVDWTVLRTSLSLQEYLTLEDAYVYVYQCRERYLGKHRGQERLGDAVSLLNKWVLGVSRLALILLALLGPLLYYSTYNPSSVPNSAAQLNFRLSFFGAYDFFSTTVRDPVATPEGWRTWLLRTRPTVGSYGLVATEQTLQLMEFTTCSSSLWMASPQALQQILAGLRAAASNTSTAYVLQTLEVVRSASETKTTAVVSLANRWPILPETSTTLISILEKEVNGVGGTARLEGSSQGSASAVAAAVSLPFFYSPFAFNRANRIDLIPTNPRFPHRNLHNCTLELNHDKDVALNTLVRYWCLHCTPLFPEGNVPSENGSNPAEWRCLTTGEDCEGFNYEDTDEGKINSTIRAQRMPLRRAGWRQMKVPMYIVVISDAVVVGISFLKGIGIVALYTTFVLALGRPLRSVLANQASTLLYSNMANPAILENMVRCIGMAREYGDLRLEHAIYLELMDLLRLPEQLFRVTGPLRSMYVDAEHDDLFRLGLVRWRDSQRSSFHAEGSSRQRNGTGGGAPAAPPKFRNE